MKRHITLFVVLALLCAAIAIPATGVRAQEKTLTVWITGSDDDATVFKAMSDL
jgi:spermidine/putrescine-binding protein